MFDIRPLVLVEYANMYPFQMIWEDIKRFFQRRRRIMVVHDYTIQSIKELAETNSLPPDEYLAGLLDEDKRRKEMDTLAMQCWYTLSDREKQVTALICAGLSTYQIAERIGTASSTVKTHLKKIYVKFQVHSRKELREKLSNYDLSRFE